MLVDASSASSGQCRRSMRKEWPRQRAIAASSTTPPAMHSVRKLSGAKSRTPAFITGQLTPQSSVSTASSHSSLRDSDGVIGERRDGRRRYGRALSPRRAASAYGPAARVESRPR
jgi:hypothetical protein